MKLVLFVGHTLAAFLLPPSGETLTKLIKTQWQEFNPSHAQLESAYGAKLQDVWDNIVSLQLKGYSMACSEQLVGAAHLASHYNDDWTRAEMIFGELNASLSNIEQDWAELQTPDGSWGPCTRSFAEQLDATIEQLSDLCLLQQRPLYPLTFLAQSPLANSLSAVKYLNSLLTSDIVHRGVNSRSDLNSAFGFLNQILFRPGFLQWVQTYTTGWNVDSQYVTAVQEWLDNVQVPSTGMWGARFINASDVLPSNDLSLTFHTVKYRSGNVSLLDNIVPTLFDMKFQPYPFGWGLSPGPAGEPCEGYNAHNEYDVVNLWTWTFPLMNASSQQLVADEILAMVDWSLSSESITNSSSSAASFNCTGQDSAGDCYYFGVSLFDVIGYWNPANLFWSKTQHFNNMPLCCELWSSFKNLNITFGIGLGAEPKFEANCKC